MEKLQSELKDLTYKFGSHLSTLKLLGGEPLLHPEIEKVLEVARETCGDMVKILLLTNGILLPRMGTIFWDICRKNKIFIGVSQYPINVKYDILEDLVKQNSVEFVTFAYRDDFWKWKISERKLPSLRKWYNFLLFISE